MDAKDIQAAIKTYLNQHTEDITVSKLIKLLRIELEDEMHTVSDCDIRTNLSRMISAGMVQWTFEGVRLVK